jgi:hypothetical protein
MAQPVFTRLLAASLVIFAGAAALGSSACIESPLGSTAYSQAIATNNKTYDGTGPNNHDFSDAVQASAAHDIPCPISQVKAHWAKDHDYVAEGCGTRINYTTKQKFAVPWRVTLVSRAKLDGTATPVATASAATAATVGATPATTGTVASAPPAGGCSKDTDCKGDRICVEAACVDPPPRPVQP